MDSSLFKSKAMPFSYLNVDNILKSPKPLGQFQPNYATAFLSEESLHKLGCVFVCMCDRKGGGWERYETKKGIERISVLNLSKTKDLHMKVKGPHLFISMKKRPFWDYDLIIFCNLTIAIRPMGLLLLKEKRIFLIWYLFVWMFWIVLAVIVQCF